MVVPKGHRHILRVYAATWLLNDVGMVHCLVLIVKKSQAFHYGGILTTERIDPLHLMSQRI